MKKLLITLMILTLYSCGETKIDYYSEYIEWTKNIIYYKGTPFSGTIVKKYSDGQLEEKIPLKDGKRDGLHEYYYENGQLWSKDSYKDGKEDGLHESYYKDGQLKRKTPYKNGKKDGMEEQYYDNGQLEGKMLFINGVTSDSVNHRNINKYFSSWGPQ